MTKKVKKRTIKSSTDFALLVESSTQEEIFEFDKLKIIDSLIIELNLSKNDSENIANIVTNKLKDIKLEYLTPSIIRNFVNVTLYENGFNEELKSKSDIILSVYDIEQIIYNANKENGNTSHNPESINLTIAERILKEYALKNIYDEEISKKHLIGDIHIHDVGMPIRWYCSGHSPEYIKKNGLKNIPTIPSSSKPAKYAGTLVRHICSITQYYTSLFAGAIGYEGLNFFFAPYLKNIPYKEIKQLAQTLIFDLSQLAGAKGGQVAFVDFNVYINIPNHYKNVCAIGQSGKYMVEDDVHDIHYFDTRKEAIKYARLNKFKVLKYKDFEKESKLFLKAILEVSKDGDMYGLTFPFPKINLHINGKTFEDKKSKGLFMLACDCVSKNGSIYFIFDRDAYSVSQCCRLSMKFNENDKKMIKTPEELRFVGGQNVSINLPNIPLITNNENDFYKELEHRMELATKAHKCRHNYVWTLANKENSPLSFYVKGMDGKPYIRPESISYLIGIVGLNECVYNLIKKELHDSDEAFSKGLEIIAFMNIKTKELSEKYNLNIKLEETPAESTSSRFAKLDKKRFGDTAFMKENEFGIYYTNSVHYAYDSEVDYIDRIKNQSKFHSLVEAGSIIHIWCNDKNPDSKAIYELAKQTWYTTDCTQWVRSPEQTVCKDCKTFIDGFCDNCPECNSENLIQQTRITGYFVRKEKFNSGKLAELKDRKREVIL